MAEYPGIKWLNFPSWPVISVRWRGATCRVLSLDDPHTPCHASHPPSTIHHPPSTMVSSSPQSSSNIV